MMNRILLITTPLLFVLALVVTCAAGCKSSVRERPEENGARGGRHEQGFAQESGGAAGGAQAATNEGAAHQETASRGTSGQTSAGQEQQLLPWPKSYVSDFARVLDEATKEKMEAKLAGLERRSGVQIAVVTVETTGDQAIYDYSLKVAQQWHVGSNTQGGMLLMVAIKDRRWRIQVTRNLEADIPDEEAARLGGLMVADFRQERYGDGLMKCLDATIKRLAARRGFSMDSSAAR